MRPRRYEFAILPRQTFNLNQRDRKKNVYDDDTGSMRVLSKLVKLYLLQLLRCASVNDESE